MASKNEQLKNERVLIILTLLNTGKVLSIKNLAKLIYGDSEEKECKKIIRHLNIIEEKNQNIFQYINISKVGKELFYDIKLDKIKINNYDPILSSFVFKLLDTSSKEKIRKKNDETIKFAIEHGYNLIFDKITNGHIKRFNIIPIYYFKEFDRIIDFPRIYTDENISAIIVDDTMTEIKIGKPITNVQHLNYKLEKIIDGNNDEIDRLYRIKNEYLTFHFKLDSFNSYNSKLTLNLVYIEMDKKMISEFTNKFPQSKNHYQLVEEENNEYGMIKLKLINKNVDKIISFLSTQEKKKFKLYINDKLYEFNF